MQNKRLTRVEIVSELWVLKSSAWNKWLLFYCSIFVKICSLFSSVSSFASTSCQGKKNSFLELLKVRLLERFKLWLSHKFRR